MFFLRHHLCFALPGVCGPLWPLATRAQMPASDSASPSPSSAAVGAEAATPPDSSAAWPA